MSKRSIDRYQTENLLGKVRDLRAKQAKLEAEVLQTGDLDKLRELSLLNHRIKVAEERRIGEWGNESHNIQSIPRVRKS